MATIRDVLILNWEPPGEPYWNRVKASQDEPLIDVRFDMTMSWNEYQKFLDEYPTQPYPPEKHRLWARLFGR